MPTELNSPAPPKTEASSAPGHHRRHGPALLALVIFATALVIMGTSYAFERNFAGSAQLDYLAVPTRVDARDITFDGFTTELSLKMAVDVNDQVTSSVKTCYGCHGFEMGMAFIDYRIAEALTVRVGRFTPSFGDFPVRHDPANHRTSDKPLPYDMGRMLRLREFGMSILPAPYVDNGLELRGTVLLGDTVDLDYAIYAIGGLRGGTDATDVDFIQSRSAGLYYVDNNSRPSGGGRLALALQLGDEGSLKWGASGLYGTYDPHNNLDYFVVGTDLVFRWASWTVRTEYLLRRTRMALGDNPATRFRYGPTDDGTFDDGFIKDGFYLETDFALNDRLELVARWDGMRRLGNVPMASPLRARSAVLRYTGGINLRLPQSMRVKLSGEIYDFSDFDDEIALHLGMVAIF